MCDRSYVTVCVVFWPDSATNKHLYYIITSNSTTQTHTHVVIKTIESKARVNILKAKQIITIVMIFENRESRIEQQWKIIWKILHWIGLFVSTFFFLYSLSIFSNAVRCGLFDDLHALNAHTSEHYFSMHGNIICTLN